MAACFVIGACPPRDVEQQAGSTTPATHVLPVGKGLAVFHQRQVDVGVTDHLGHRTAEAVSGLDLEGDPTADG
jgi:hypothetical protein